MDYEINDDTLAIIPCLNNSSKIIEYDTECIVNNSPYEVMEYSCEYFGSSLAGRIHGAKKILGSIYKVPLFVDDSRNIVFFPTKSPTASDNIWLSLNNIDHYRKISDNRTAIFFKNGQKFIVDLPYYSINNQVLRATRLENVVNERKSQKKTIKMQKQSFFSHIYGIINM